MPRDTGAASGPRGAGPARTGRSLRLHTDGASRGNPGPAAIGVVIADADTGAVVEEISKAVGRTTNNVAEYQALLAGLRRALDLGAEAVEVWSDSELLVRQMQGIYQVKHPALAPLHREAVSLGRRLPAGLRMRHTMRGGNARADELANLALDAQGTGAAVMGAAGTAPASVRRRTRAPGGAGSGNGPVDSPTGRGGLDASAPAAAPAAGEESGSGPRAGEAAASGPADAAARGDGGASLAGAGLDALGIAAGLPGGGSAEIGPGLRVARLDAGGERDCPWGLVLRGRVEVGGRPLEPGQGWREPCHYRAAGADGAVVLECWTRR